MKWIKHDTDANMDAKLQEVLLDYGLEGYGLYWYCLELIAGKVDKDNLTFELEHDARIIARNVGSTTQKIEEMMKKFIELELFENSNGRVTCLKLARRLDKSMTSNPAMRNLIGSIKNHDGVMTNHDGVMIASGNPMQDKIRLDKNRIDKISCNHDKSKLPHCPYQKIVDLYHEVLPELNSVVKLSEKRKQNLRARWREDQEHQDLGFWKNYFSYVRQSDFLMGRKQDARNWKADFDFLITQSKFLSTMEGKYHA